MARYWIHDDGSILVEKRDPLALHDRPWREVIPVVVGSREWAVFMVLRGERVWNDGMGGRGAAPRIGETAASMYCLTHDSVASQLDSGWYVVPPSPPPLKRGDRVRWWAEDLDGTASYIRTENANGDYPYQVAVGVGYFWVERVERIEEPKP